MTDVSLTGRVVVITGGGRGFGRELALAFAAKGARLVLTGAKNRSELEETITDANRISGGCCVGLIADAASPTDAEAVARTANDAFGTVDILINNAARGPTDAMPRYDRVNPLPFWAADPVRYAEVIGTNVVGPFLLAQQFSPGMVAGGFGRIINISTSRPTMIVRGAGPYGASKAALEASTIVWARDLEGTGVTVNALLPGAASDTALIPGGSVGTRTISNYRPGQGELGDVGRMPGLLPPDILVPAALWIASDQSGNWNGRRFVAKDWDPDLPGAVAAEKAAAHPQNMPTIM